MLRFVGNVDQLGHTRLHFECQLILRDARANFRIIYERIMCTVEPIDCGNDIPLHFTIDPRW